MQSSSIYFNSDSESLHQLKVVEFNCRSFFNRLPYINELERVFEAHNFHFEQTLTKNINLIKSSSLDIRSVACSLASICL